MKRISALLTVLALCLLILTMQVLAEDGASTMVLKENSGAYEINGRKLEFEKPYMEQDTLMSCLDPILKAMNITLEKSTDGQTITLKYSGSVIIMNMGSREASVDGVKTTAPQAPASVNGSIMVPLRFVVENFGAEVSVDSETGYVTVTKEIAGDNSIKDFSLILKKTSKEIVGDSYYNWSMNLPKDVKISYRNFNGSYNTFEAVDKSYFIILSIYDLQPGENLDTMLAAELQYTKDYTLISQGKLNKNGTDFFKIVYKDDKAIYEERDFIKNNKVYELFLQIEDDAKYRDDKELAALMDSFAPEFRKGAGIEDLSDVGADGRRVYEDKKLKFSVKVPADWYESGYDGKENQVTFVEPYKGASGISDSYTISMFSKEDGLTLEDWKEDELQYLRDEYNPELVKIVEDENITINGVSAAKIVISMKLRDKTVYYYNVYLTGESYRYTLSYITQKSYSNTIVKNSINSLLGSFSFTEPDPEETGSFLDAGSLIKDEGVRQVGGKDRGFTFEVPTSWSMVQQQNTDSIAYSGGNASMYVSVTTKKGVSEKEYTDSLIEYFTGAAAVSSGYIYKGKQVINEKGLKITRLDIDIVKDDSVYDVQYYILGKNNNTYEVLLFLRDIRASEKNKKIISDIWNSLKFE